MPAGRRESISREEDLPYRGDRPLIVLLVAGYFIFRPGDGRTGSTQPPGGAALARLAVLPFVNLRSDPQTDFLGFALADQIIGNLSYVRTLIVRPASAVRKYQTQSVEPAVAGHDLDVDLVLTGNYLKEADIIRLSLELVDLKSNAILWRGSLKERVRRRVQTAGHRGAQGG